MPCSTPQVLATVSTRMKDCASAYPPDPFGPSRRATSTVVAAPVIATATRLAPDMTAPPVSGRDGGTSSLTARAAIESDTPLITAARPPRRRTATADLPRPPRDHDLGGGPGA